MKFKLFEKSKVKLSSPANGQAINLSEVKDPVFSQGILGQGIGVIPQDGNIVAPGDGVVTVVSDSKHVICMRDENELDLIIHIGVDSFELEESFFIVKTAEGDVVKKGDMLVEFDYEESKKRGIDMTTVLLLSSANYKKLKCLTGGVVSNRDVIMEVEL